MHIVYLPIAALVEVMGDFIYHYIRCIRQVRFEGSWHPKRDDWVEDNRVRPQKRCCHWRCVAVPVRYDYMESVKIRIIKSSSHRGKSQCHGAQAATLKMGPISWFAYGDFSKLLLLAPSSWRSGRLQIPRLSCDTHWNQNDTVFGITRAYVHAMFWEWTTWKHCTLAKCEHASETLCSLNTHLLDIMAFRTQIILSSLPKKQGCFITSHSSQPPLGGSQPLQPMRAGHSCLAAALLGQCVSCHGTADGGISKEKGYPVHQVKSEKDDHGGLYHDFFAKWSKKP